MGQTSSVTTHSRVGKSETREMVERDRVKLGRVHEPTDWQMSNATFFTLFVIIAAAIAIGALVLR